MIVRIVKLTFQPEQVEEFQKLFKEERKTIATFEGCYRVDLWQDTDAANVFFTYSEWSNKESLEKYRSSEFFKSTWSRAKTFFSDKPQAWSLNKVEFSNS